MRDHHLEFEAKGTNVAAIGMGLTAMAADFKERQKIPFTLLVDRDRKTYRAIELERGGLFDVAGPRQIVRGVKNLVTGNVQGRPAPKQDVLQLGGALVIGPGGNVLYEHRATSSDDNAPPEELLNALP